MTHKKQLLRQAKGRHQKRIDDGSHSEQPDFSLENGHACEEEQSENADQSYPLMNACKTDLRKHIQKHIQEEELSYPGEEAKQHSSDEGHPCNQCNNS